MNTANRVFLLYGVLFGLVADPYVLGFASASGKPREVLKISQRRSNLNPMVGSWVGHYYCAQGLTSLQLDVQPSSGDNINAIFSFSEHPRNPGVPSGSFQMQGRIEEGDRIFLKGSQWIRRPQNYYVVNLDGRVNIRTNKFDGSVTGLRGCTTFSLSRRTSNVSTSLPNDVRVLTGTYYGYYYCTQGLTRLRLDIWAHHRNQIDAVFSFSEHPRNTGIPSGSFKMQGSLEGSNRLRLYGGEWISRPTGWSTVDIDGKATNSLDRISGSVTNPGCSSFQVSRSSPLSSSHQLESRSQAEKPIVDGEWGSNARQVPSTLRDSPNRYQSIVTPISNSNPWLAYLLNEQKRLEGRNETFRLTPEQLTQLANIRRQISRLLESFDVGVGTYEVIGDNVNLLDKRLHPGLRTTFYIHGWNSDHQEKGSRRFAEAIISAKSVDQGVMVDWGQGSRTGEGQFGESLSLAAARIPAVARNLAKRILASGLDESDVDLVGHSLGAYVAVHTALILNNEYNYMVNSVTLLDPANLTTVMPSGAYDPPELSELGPKTSTLSIYAQGTKLKDGNLASSPSYAKTARLTIRLDPPGLTTGRDWANAHSYPIDFYARLIEINSSAVIDELRAGERPFQDLFPGAQIHSGSRPAENFFVIPYRS